jgi:hypothetical protein
MGRLASIIRSTRPTAAHAFGIDVSVRHSCTRLFRDTDRASAAFQCLVGHSWWPGRLRLCGGVSAVFRGEDAMPDLTIDPALLARLSEVAVDSGEELYRRLDMEFRRS